MAEVFAGFVCGYVVALVLTPLMAWSLLRARASSQLLARVLPPGVSALGLAVLLHGAMFILWTGLGILLGLILLAMRDAEGALGSLNAAFSLLVFAITLALAAPLVALLRQMRLQLVLAATAVLLVFGWLMPYAAEWSKFD